MKLNKEQKLEGRTMHQFQHLVNLLNQILAALFTLLLAIWTRLRNAREAKGLTIEEAAELIGVAPVTFSRWERLRQKPHLSNQVLLSEIFGESDDSVPEEFLPPSYWN